MVKEKMENGKLPETALKRSVFKQLKTKRKEIVNGAAVGEDCAIFQLPENGKIATCSQEAVIKVDPNGKFGPDCCISVQQLIYRCLNNLAAEAAQPFALLLNLMLPEGFEEPELKKLMAQVAAVCEKKNIQLAGGQTFLTAAVRNPVAVAVAYGQPADKKNHTVKAVRPGQDLVVTKWVGLEGTAILAKERKKGLLTRYPGYLIEKAEGFGDWLSVSEEAEIAVANGVCGMHDCSKGGIFAALWELAEGAGVGLEVDLKKIPLRQETVEICEFCNCNPYELLSGGSLLLSAEDGERLAETLMEKGIPAVVVGKVIDSNDRILHNEEETRFMDRPRKDEIFRILSRNIG